VDEEGEKLEDNAEGCLQSPLLPLQMGLGGYIRLAVDRFSGYHDEELCHKNISRGGGDDSRGEGGGRGEVQGLKGEKGERGGEGGVVGDDVFVHGVLGYFTAELFAGIGIFFYNFFYVYFLFA
jgi:hypothetical protein